MQKKVNARIHERPPQQKNMNNKNTYNFCNIRANYNRSYNFSNIRANNNPDLKRNSHVRNKRTSSSFV